ncbi:TPA: DNA translocase FtsK, partial [Escherichia coli]|nr:DNA translocase FtsK [Escherichia coli]
MLKEFIVKQRAKNELIKAFLNMGLYKTYQKGNGRELKVYPKIHDVDFQKDKTQYVFTLVNGMDPKELEKKEYVLQQHFGKNIELDGDYKNFTLKIYKTSMPEKLKYNAKTITQNIRGLKLGIICGVDRNGQYVSFDLTKHPH